MFSRRSERFRHNIAMLRLVALAFAALVSAAPLSEAAAQDRGPPDRPGFGGPAFGPGRGHGGQDRPRPERRDSEVDAPRMMSEAQAQAIAQRRAGGARFVGSLGLRGSSYVFRFERDGRIIDIAIDARGG